MDNKVGQYIERFCDYCHRSIGCNPYWRRIDGGVEKNKCYQCVGKERKQKKQRKQKKK